MMRFASGGSGNGAQARADAARPAFGLEHEIAGVGGRAPRADPRRPSEAPISAEHRLRHRAAREHDPHVPGELHADVIAYPGDELSKSRAARKELLVLGQRHRADLDAEARLAIPHGVARDGGHAERRARARNAEARAL